MTIEEVEIALDMMITNMNGTATEIMCHYGLFLELRKKLRVAEGNVLTYKGLPIKFDPIAPPNTLYVLSTHNVFEV
jgi:hypothetical protein